MSFQNKPFVSVSQPDFSNRTRCLTAFIALTANRYAAEQAISNKHRRLAWFVVGALTTFFFLGSSYATGIWATLSKLALPVAALVLVILVSPSVQLFGSPRAARRAGAMRRLDRERASIGLQNAIDPALCELFERVARQWERLENSLQAKIWEGHRSLQQQIDFQASDAFADLIALNVEGHPADSSFALESKMKLLANLVEALTNALSAYSRESVVEETPEGYPEVQAVLIALQNLAVNDERVLVQI